MYWEAQGKYDEADKIYKDMLETQPTNETAAKRMVRAAGSREQRQDHRCPVTSVLMWPCCGNSQGLQQWFAAMVWFWASFHSGSK